MQNFIYYFWESYLFFETIHQITCIKGNYWTLRYIHLKFQIETIVFIFFAIESSSQVNEKWNDSNTNHKPICWLINLASLRLV